VDVCALSERVDEERIGELAAHADVVLDGSDNFATRHAVNRVCVRQRKPLVSGAAVRFDGQVAVFDMRRDDAPCYACLFPEAGENEDAPCALMGVFAPVTGIIGTIQAAEALKLLAEVGEVLSGRLLLVDALTMQLRTIRLTKDPACATCGAGPEGVSR
jgi:molybdopterin/thiamine biosynthesis adenylyltransferase